MEWERANKECASTLNLIRPLPPPLEKKGSSISGVHFASGISDFDLLSFGWSGVDPHDVSEMSESSILGNGFYRAADVLTSAACAIARIREIIER
jgi:hypothetical protein